MRATTPFAALVAITTLAGCAINGTGTADPALSNLDGVTLGSDGTNQFVEQVEFVYGTDGAEKPLPLCIAQNVTNRSTSVTGETSSYLSPITGNRYSTQGTNDIGGGEALSYISQDEKSVVANGNTSYTFKSGFVPIKRTVRFSLNAEQSENNLILSFDNLEQVQNDAGAAPLGGYHGLGAWQGGGGVMAYGALEEVARGVRDCLTGS